MAFLSTDCSKRQLESKVGMSREEVILLFFWWECRSVVPLLIVLIQGHQSNTVSQSDNQAEKIKSRFQCNHESSIV